MSLNSRTTEELIHIERIYNEITHIAAEVMELYVKIEEIFAYDLIIDRTIVAQINHLAETTLDLVYDLPEDDPCRDTLLYQHSKHSLFVPQT